MSYLKKYSPLFLTVAVIGDFSVPYILGLFDSHFHQITDIISKLGETTSPMANYFNHASILTGSLFVLSSLGSVTYFPQEPKRFHQLLSFSLALYGFGDCILSGLIRIGAHQSFFSLPYLLHASFTGLGMLGMMFLSIICGSRMYEKGKRSWANFYMLCLLGSLVFFALFAAYYLPYIGSFLTPTRGLWQRLSLLFLYLPALSLLLHQTD